jgi:hypothetical protein
VQRLMAMLTGEGSSGFNPDVPLGMHLLGVSVIPPIPHMAT